MAKQLGVFTVPVIAGDAASPGDGDVWYNSSTGKFRKREGGVTSDMDTTGGSGSVALTTVEKNLSTVPKKSGKFTITGVGLTVSKPVFIQQANGPYTGKGTLADEAEMDGLIVKGKVTSATNIDCYWNSATFVIGNFKFDYFIGL